jgi:hypothetical protein
MTIINPNCCLWKLSLMPQDAYINSSKVQEKWNSPSFQSTEIQDSIQALKNTM